MHIAISILQAVAIFAVPALTRQLDKPQLTAPGLICGSLGYAVGTFLGLGMFLILV